MKPRRLSKVDRTYVKRKRPKKPKLLAPAFRKNELVWAIWIERDGTEIKKVNSRAITDYDLKRNAKDFGDKHEVLSAFVMVVTKDTPNNSNKTRVFTLESTKSKWFPSTKNTFCKSSNVSNKYLFRFSLYDPSVVKKAVYKSIERMWIRKDYKEYYNRLKFQQQWAADYLSFQNKLPYDQRDKTIQYFSKLMNGDDITKTSSNTSSSIQSNTKWLSRRRSRICVTNSLQNDDIDGQNCLDNPREDPMCQYHERNDNLHQNHLESPCNGDKAYSDTGLVRSNIQMIPSNGNRLHDFNFIACDNERIGLAINKDDDPFGNIDLVEFENVSIPTDAINSSSSDVCEKVGAQTKVNIDPIIDDEMQGASIVDNGNNEMKIYNSSLDSVMTNPSSINIENTAQNDSCKFMGKYDDCNDTTCPTTSSIQLLTNLLVSKDHNSKKLRKSTSKMTSDNLDRMPNTSCSKQKNTSCKLSESSKNNACNVNDSSSLTTRNMRKRSPVDYKRLSLLGSEALSEKMSKSQNDYDFDNEDDGIAATPARSKLIMSSANKELRGSARKKTTDLSSVLSNMKRHKKLAEIEQNEEAAAAAQANKPYERALYGDISPPKDFQCLDDYASRGFITGSQLSQNDALPDLEEYSSNVMLGFPKPDNQNLSMELKSRKKQFLLSPPPNTMKTSSSVISGQKQVTIPEGSTMGGLHELSTESASIHHSANVKIANSVSNTREINSTETMKPTIIPIKRKLTLEHRHKYPVSNGEILNFLTKKQTLSYLNRILNEKVKSQRHDIVCNMFRSGKLDFSMRSKIFQLTRADFLENDHKIDNQLLKTMSKVLEGVNLPKIPGMLAKPADSLVYQGPDNRNNYIWHVLVPEAIIKYLQEKNGWDKCKAEKFYLDGESRVTDEELKEFDEELEEDARRYQRQKLEDSYDSSEEDEWLDEHEDVDMDLPNIS